MFCRNCGSELREGALFCPNCGSKVAQAEENISNNVPKQETNIRSIKKAEAKESKFDILSMWYILFSVNLQENSLTRLPQHISAVGLLYLVQKATQSQRLDSLFKIQISRIA